MKKQERKLSGTILAGTFITPAVMSAAQANVVSANFCKSLYSSESSFFTKKAGESLLKYMATKILPCVIVVLGVVLLATVAQSIYRYFAPVKKEEEKKLESFFKVEEDHEVLNKNVKKVIDFLEKYSELLGFEGTVIEIPGSLVSKIFDESYDIFSEEKPIDKNLEEAKRQNKVEFKILYIYHDKEADAFCLKLKLKQNGAWLDKTYETRYINKKHLIEFFNYVLEKSSNKNNLEYKLKFEIRDGDAYLIKIKKETNEEVNKISIDEAEKNTTALEPIVEFCYERKLKGIFEKTFIFKRSPKEFRISGNICATIFLLLRNHAKELGTKLGDEDGITFDVKGSEAVNFLKLDGIKDNVKNKLKNLEKVKLEIFYIREEGDIALTMSKEDGTFKDFYYTKYSTTNVGKIVDFVNFLLSKANEERKDGVEFKLEKVVTGQSTHVKLVKTKNGVKEQEAFITKKLVDDCKSLDDIFKEDLFISNIEDEFNLDLENAENRKLNLNFELNDDEGIQKLDEEESFFEEGEILEL